MAITLTPIDVGLLHSLLKYCPDSGHLAWRNPAHAARNRGRAQAGKLNGRRRIVHVNRHYYWASSICWALHYGVWPANTPSAKNGLPDDLRISNLTLDFVPVERGPGGYSSLFSLDTTPEQQLALNEAQALHKAMLDAKRLAYYGTVHTSVRQDMALDAIPDPEPAPTPPPQPEDDDSCLF